MVELGKKDRVVQKYARIEVGFGRREDSTRKKGGVETLVTGDFKEFRQPILKEKLNTAMLFTLSSEQKYRDRVLDSLTAIGDELGFDLLLAGRDFPIHCTTLEGVYEDEASRPAAFAKMTTDPRLAELLEPLVGLEIEFRYLLRAGNTLILTATDIPQAVLTARQQLAELYQTRGFRPLPMDNILHVSAARIIKLPAEERNKRLLLFNKMAVQLRHQISGSPLTMEVAGVANLLKEGLLDSNPHIFAGRHQS